MHIHLDPVGGCAGDMFIGAMLDAWPELTKGLHRTLSKLGLPESVRTRVDEHCDHALTGTRFRVLDESIPEGHKSVKFSAVRTLLNNATLSEAIRDRALAIFTLLAEAESQVHGTTIDEISFHEVGGWDSIADVVGAAYLIEVMKEATWSVGPIPMGSGRVDSAHGLLPVPAPATVLLLKGRAVVDDGIEGERVTPTGAAILRYLDPAHRVGEQPLCMSRSGIGFGTRTFPDISNVLRVLAFDTEPAGQPREIGVIHFEVDDQPAEDLAVALGTIRSLDEVFEVVQAPVFGKKGRLVTQIQILAQPDRLSRVIETCFTETTTLGLRWHLARGMTLERKAGVCHFRDQRIRVKCSTRPSGEVTGKAEMDDLAGAVGGFAGRARIRQEAEQLMQNVRRNNE